MMTIMHPILEAALRAYGRIAPTERGGFRMVRWVRRFRPRDRWRDTFRTPQGLSLDLDLATYPDCCMAFGLYEIETARLIRKLLRPGDHFVDGGANLGYFTLLAAQRVGVVGRVDAFEPEPANRARLEAHLAQHDFAGNVTVHPAALAAEAGIAQIHCFEGPDANHGCASLFAAGQVAAGRRTQVPTVALDEVLQGAVPRLIKLDLEGAEPMAVRGMARTLQSERPPTLIVEHNRASAQAAGDSPDTLVRTVLALQPRYRVRVVDWPPERIEPTDAGYARLATLRQCNLLFTVG